MGKLASLSNVTNAVGGKLGDYPICYKTFLAFQTIGVAIGVTKLLSIISPANENRSSKSVTTCL